MGDDFTLILARSNSADAPNWVDHDSDRHYHWRKSRTPFYRLLTNIADNGASRSKRCANIAIKGHIMGQFSLVHTSSAKPKRLGLHYAFALSLAVAVGAMLASTDAMAQTIVPPAPATTVQLTSAVAVERSETAADGSTTTTFANPKTVTVVPGDKLIFTLTYTNLGDQPAANFIATNPMPAAVQFADVRENGAEVSVDGGKTWGALATLAVIQTVPAPVPEGETASAVVEASEVARPATAADVTHVRWKFAEAIAPKATGTLSFKGVVK